MFIIQRQYIFHALNMYKNVWTSQYTFIYMYKYNIKNTYDQKAFFGQKFCFDCIKLRNPMQIAWRYKS